MNTKKKARIAHQRFLKTQACICYGFAVGGGRQSCNMKLIGWFKFQTNIEIYIRNMKFISAHHIPFLEYYLKNVFTHMKRFDYIFVCLSLKGTCSAGQFLI